MKYTDFRQKVGNEIVPLLKIKRVLCSRGCREEKEREIEKEIEIEKE